MIEKVLVLDPGERVGWARAVIENGVIVEGFVANGVTPLKDMAIALGKSIGKYDTVAYESWHLRPDMAKKMIGNDFQASQFIGIVRYLGWTTEGVSLKSLPPNKKKTGRKAMPAWIKVRLALSTEEHDKDALDLLAYYWWDKYV